MLNWLPAARWAHGLVGAAISSAANTVSVMIVDPADFNLADGLHKVLMVATVSAIIGAALYLSKSPLPTWDGIERRS